MGYFIRFSSDGCVNLIIGHKNSNKLSITAYNGVLVFYMNVSFFNERSDVGFLVESIYGAIGVVYEFIK